MAAASSVCASCQEPTVKKCGCVDAPLYNESITPKTYYCSEECQKADYTNHKSKCRNLRERKTLRRAALLLQAIMCKIRQHASPLRFDSVHFEDSSASYGVPTAEPDSHPESSVTESRISIYGFSTDDEVQWLGPSHPCRGISM